MIDAQVSNIRNPVLMCSLSQLYARNIAAKTNQILFINSFFEVNYFTTLILFAALYLHLWVKINKTLFCQVELLIQNMKRVKIKIENVRDSFFSENEIKFVFKTILTTIGVPWHFVNNDSNEKVDIYYGNVPYLNADLSIKRCLLYTSDAADE